MYEVNPLSSLSFSKLIFLLMHCDFLLGNTSNAKFHLKELGRQQMLPKIQAMCRTLESKRKTNKQINQ
jgi:hypothetical protein